MTKLIAGVALLVALLGAPTVLEANAGRLSREEERHGRMEDQICARPRHFLRWHGIEIMPESCDR